MQMADKEPVPAEPGFGTEKIGTVPGHKMTVAMKEMWEKFVPGGEVHLIQGSAGEPKFALEQHSMLPKKKSKP